MSGEPAVRDAIVRIISEMLDNPDESGIYPTSKEFDKLEILFAERLRELERSHDEALEEIKLLTAPQDVGGGRESWLRKKFHEASEERDRLRERVAELERYQHDWRKGVELIASALGDLQRWR